MHTLTITHTNIHPSVPTRTHTRTHTYTYTHSKKAEQAAAQEALRAIMNEGQQQLGGHILTLKDLSKISVIFFWEPSRL
jgi:hypothetical protein